MNTEKKENQSSQISQQNLLAFVRAMIGANGGREDDEHPLPPGPWDPVIRAALERSIVFGPHPDPWRAFSPGVPWRTLESALGRLPDPWKVALASLLAGRPEIWDAIGPILRRGDEVALNPQPLPPRYAFLIAVTQAVISRAELLQDIADATASEGEQRGIIIVGGFTSRFSDDWCGNGFRLKWPFPGPRPNWFANELEGIDLVVMATQFEQAAEQTFSPALRQHLANTSAKFVDAGLSKASQLTNRSDQIGKSAVA